MSYKILHIPTGLYIHSLICVEFKRASVYLDKEPFLFNKYEIEDTFYTVYTFSIFSQGNGCFEILNRNEFEVLEV